MSYPNGTIPSSALTKAVAGVYLISSASKSLDRLGADFKKKFKTSLRATSGNRTVATQRTIFLARYIRQNTGGGYYGDVRYYLGQRYVRRRGTAAAAVPGTSNHGFGIAVDLHTGDGFGSFTSAQYKWMVTNGAKHGWSNAEGRSVNEPWHWVHNAANDKKAPKTAAKTRKPRKLAVLSHGKRKGSWQNRVWQQYLRSQGHKIVVDKIFGAATTAATKSWQKSRGLTPDGIVGIASWSGACFGIRQGSRSPAVEIWQNIVGLTGKNADAIFGAKTATHSKETQRWLGVTPDAIIGSNTIGTYRKKA